MNRFLDLNAKGLPVQAANPLCFPALNGSQVAELFLVPFGLSPPDDWTDYAEWEALVDNEAADGYRRIAGIGGVPSPQVYKTSLPRLRGQKVTGRGFQLTLTTIGITDEIYALAQRFQSSQIDFRFWYVTVSKVIYGGDFGILPHFIDAATPLDEARGETEKALFTLDYLADASPNRSAAGLADQIIDVTPQDTVFVLDDGTVLTDEEDEVLINE